MKKGFKKYSIFIPVYERNLDIYIINNKRKLKKHLERIMEWGKDVKGITKNWAGKTLLLDTGDCVILLDHKYKIGTLVHEVYHVVYNILEYSGVNDEESFAYLLGWITDQLHVRLNPKGKLNIKYKTITKTIK